MDSHTKFRWASAATVLIVIAAVIYVTKAFLTTILWSVFFAYLLSPIYSYFISVTKNKQISSLLTISMVFLVFMILLLGVVDAMVIEVSDLSESEYALQDIADDFFSFISGLVDRYVPGAASYAEDAGQQLEDLAGQVLPKLLALAGGMVADVAARTPIYLAQFGVSILLVYYLLIDGKNAMNKAVSFLPEQGIVSQFLDELGPIYHSLFNVYFITCVLTGCIAAIGFTLLNISYPIIWGAAVALFALLPLVGTNTVIVPMVLYHLVIQDYSKGGILLIFGIIFLNIIPENIIRPRLALHGAAIHPVITLLAFAAPLFVVGMVGIVVGPALYGFLLAAYRTKIRLIDAASAAAPEEEQE